MKADTAKSWLEVQMGRFREVQEISLYRAISLSSPRHVCLCLFFTISDNSDK